MGACCFPRASSGPIRWACAGLGFALPGSFASLSKRPLGWGPCPPSSLAQPLSFSGSSMCAT